MIEIIGGCIILWLACGLLSWPLLGGVWMRDFEKGPEVTPLPICGPVATVGALIFWLTKKPSVPRIAWLYGVKNGEKEDIWIPFQFAALFIWWIELGRNLIDLGTQAKLNWVLISAQTALLIWYTGGVFLSRYERKREREEKMAMGAVAHTVTLTGVHSGIPSGGGGSASNNHGFYQSVTLPEPEPSPRDPEFGDTMGYRLWALDVTGTLRSPHVGTPWPDSELHCDDWCEENVVRGVQGIHAHFVPPEWQRDQGQSVIIGGGPLAGCLVISGVVERFGKYVMGTDGWRAEWVIIRKLIAPNRFVAAGLREMYPDVEIIIGE